MNLLDNLSGSGNSVDAAGSYLSERSYQTSKSGTTTTTVEHIKNGTITTTTTINGFLNSNHSSNDNSNSNSGTTTSSNYGQGQIELVEKILNQISLHQTSSALTNSAPASSAALSGQSVPANNSSQSMVIPNSIVDRPPKISYSKKMMNCGNVGTADNAGPSSNSASNYHHYSHLDSSNSYSAKAKFRTNLPKYPNSHHADQQVKQQSLTPEAQDSQCAQCEYYFIDGQIIPKTECNHQQQQQQQQNNNNNSSSNNNPSRNRLSDNFSSKTVHPKSHYNRNKINNQQQSQPQQTMAYSNRNGPNLNLNHTSNNCNSNSEPSRSSHPRQCIIQKNKCQDVKKFVEAQIVFDQNIIDIVPVLQINQTVNSTDNQEKDNDLKDSKLTQMDIKAEVVKVTDNEPAKRSDNENKNSGESGRQPNLNANEKSKSKEVKPTNNTSRNLSPQTVKKIRCLIANFITIQVDEDDVVVEDNSAIVKDSSTSQDDILSSIDCEKLGFQNFDGKNIGLYKNIGYINRNKTKFVRPTRDLLHLLVHGKILQKYDEALVSDIDLYQFYDNHNPKSYVKKFAYSILDSLINEDDNLMRQIRTRCYRYPDCEYSSDGDDYMNSFEPFGNSSAAAASSSSIYPKSNNESYILDNALHSKGVNHHSIDTADNCPGQHHDRDADIVVISCNKEIIIPGNMQRDLKQQRNNAEQTTSNSSDITLLQQQLLNSYFITEVSFSC